MKRALLLLSGLLVAPAVVAQTNLFPFVLPWDDATPSVADVSAWLDKPAGARGFVTPSHGHFYVGNRRIRFFGVNFVGPGAFPRHEDAGKIRLRKPVRKFEGDQIQWPKEVSGLLIQWSGQQQLAYEVTVPISSWAKPQESGIKNTLQEVTK